MNRPLVFGEVLFDVFPDGTEVLGGAAFNVAWDLRGLGLDPLLVSRVGNDERGLRVLDAMRVWGLEAKGVQVDSSRPTGIVQVEIEDGEPRFSIRPDQAYDAIDAAQAQELLHGEDISLLYHGTLAARSPASRAALDALRATGYRSCVDINLRPPWWNLASVESLLRGASIVKLNEAELTTLAEDRPTDRSPGVDASEGSRPVEDLTDDRQVEARAHAFRRRWRLDQLIVTLGAEGAIVVRQDDPEGHALRVRSEPVARLADTVGAGDAFISVMIVAETEGWSIERAMERAVQFAARVCTLQGATTSDASFYRIARAGWK